MTGPAVAPAPHIPTGEEWEQAQYAPHRVGQDPNAKGPLGRIPTGEEWAQLQATPGGLKSLTFPAMPKIAAEATKTPASAKTKGTPLAPFDLGDPSTYFNPVLRQLVLPMIEHPFESAGMLAAPFVAGAVAPAAGLAVGAAMAGQMVYHIAQYGWQKAAEMSLSPEDRARAEADPERISGESAAVQAAMLGLAPLIHVGVKAAFGGPSIGAGMMESGARGVGEIGFGPEFSPGFQEGSARVRGRILQATRQAADARANSDFATELEQGAATARIPASVDHPAGFIPSTPARAGANVRPLPGIEVPESGKVGKVQPIDTQSPADVISQDVEAGRTSAELRDEELTRQAALRALTGVRRRPGGLPIEAARAADAARVSSETRESASGSAPYFETPQGAEVLGAMAARHGLPDDAVPYHPDSPLAEAWKSGHDASTSSYPEGFTMGGALTDNRIPSDYKPVRPPGFEPTENEALVDAIKPSRFRGHSDEELGNVMRSARDQVEQAKRVIAKEDARDAPDIEAIDQAEHTIERAQTALADAEREHAMRGGGVPGEPAFKGPVSLYRRIGDDALVSEYRRLQEKRAADQEAAVPPMWDADREARAVENIEDRRRPDGSLSPADKRRLGTLQLQSGEDYGNGRHTFESAAAERRVTEYTRHITAIEREMQSRGLDVSDARPSGGLTPVAGEGDLKTRGLAAGVERAALANKLTGTLGDLPEYRTLSMADQADRASSLVDENPDLARRVALGEVPAPHGLLPESVFVAVERKALAEGDVTTLRDLANSELTQQATTMGQRIRALGERDPESPVAAIQKVADARGDGVKGAEGKLTEAIATLKEHIAKATAMTDKDWTAFVDSLRC